MRAANKSKLDSGVQEGFMWNQLHMGQEPKENNRHGNRFCHLPQLRVGKENYDQQRQRDNQTHNQDQIRGIPQLRAGASCPSRIDPEGIKCGAESCFPCVEIG